MDEEKIRELATNSATAKTQELLQDHTARFMSVIKFFVSILFGLNVVVVVGAVVYVLFWLPTRAAEETYQRAQPEIKRRIDLQIARTNDTIERANESIQKLAADTDDAIDRITLSSHTVEQAVGKVSVYGDNMSKLSEKLNAINTAIQEASAKLLEIQNSEINKNYDIITQIGELTEGETSLFEAIDKLLIDQPEKITNLEQKIETIASVRIETQVFDGASYDVSPDQVVTISAGIPRVGGWVPVSGGYRIEGVSDYEKYLQLVSSYPEFATSQSEMSKWHFRVRNRDDENSIRVKSFVIGMRIVVPAVRE